jgi:hypothetical protein
MKDENGKLKSREYAKSGVPEQSVISAFIPSTLLRTGFSLSSFYLVFLGLVWRSIHHEGHEEHEGKKI